MGWRLRLLIFCSLGVTVAVAAVLRSGRPPQDQQSDVAISAALADHQYNLPTGGREFLLNEADASDFFLLGELHGDNEIPHLLKDLWREMVPRRKETWPIGLILPTRSSATRL